MAAFKNINLIASTVTYNGVTFGGSSAPEKSLPPRFALTSQVVYDSSGRTAKGIRHVLGVQCIFYEASQSAMATNMANLREKLSQPARKLEVRGLGLDLDTIEDIAGGPKPLGKPTMAMLGENAWELLWNVEFTLNPCYEASELSKWLTLNYSTNWSNDFEGNCTRSIRGYYEIPHVRDNNAPNTALDRAEMTRGGVQIEVPDGFRRIQNDWSESEDKKRMDFSVVDQQMNGTPYPVDVIEADGDESFTTDPLTWAKASVSLNLTYRVAPGKNRTLGGVYFLAAAIAKQQAMSALIPAPGAVIPRQLSIRNGKYQSSQVTSGSITWELTGCVENFLSAGGLWSRVGDNTYGQWKASIESLWANKGNADINALKDDDVIIDLCSEVSEAEFGRDEVTIPDANPAGALAFACPDIPDAGGWMGYDLQLRVIRDDNQTLHRRAVTYTPTDPSSTVVDSDSVAIGGPEYSSSSTTEHIIENNGIPTVLIALRWKGMRYQNKPTMPEVRTVGGLPCTLIKQDIEAPTVMGSLMGCPFYKSRGYRIYRVNGYVSTVKKVQKKGECNGEAGDSPYDY